MRFERALVLALLTACTSPPRAHGPLPQQVYVWQRDWTLAVVEAVRTHTPPFQRTLLLGAEVSWNGRVPQVAWVHIPANAVPPRPVAIVLRVNPLPGGLGQGDAAQRLHVIAMDLLQRTRVAGLQIVELQIDHDAATAHLADYARWLRLLHADVADVELTITALPTWLTAKAWQDVAQAVDGFVLQVHALVAPAGAGSPAHLCDPVAAQRAVERAAQAGKPFRVALPTYAYGVAYAADGRLLGLVAEQQPPQLPPGTQWRELAADPAELAQLLLAWQGDRPQNLIAISWFRLPVLGDPRNWAWPTLQAVREGRSPQPNLRLESRLAPDGSIEILARNAGEADAALPDHVAVHWSASGPRGPAQLLTSDVLPPYVRADAGEGLRLQRASERVRLRPETTQVLGWLRLDGVVGVEVRDEP